MEKMKRYATDLKLSFMVFSYFPLWSNLVSFYLLPCTMLPACQPEGCRPRDGNKGKSARMKIKRHTHTLSLFSPYFAREVVYQKLSDGLRNGEKVDKCLQ